MRNKLIVFEGIDGVGKTSIAHRLKHKLELLGINVKLYEDDIEDKHKGFNIIKPFIQECVSNESSLFFYLASAIYKSIQIDKELKSSWVICDRYIFSTLASHFSRGIRIEDFVRIKNLPIILPDHFFLITAKECNRMRRIIKRENRCMRDLVRKRRGSEVAEMERYLKCFKPEVISNNRESINGAIQQILAIIRDNKK